MASRTEPEKDRTITFGPNDFDPYFEKEGIDPNTLTASEWRAFENMFIEGTGWTEVAAEAAWNIKTDRLVELNR